MSEQETQEREKQLPVTLPTRQEMEASASLLPVLDRLEEAASFAQYLGTMHVMEQVLEGFLMVEAVAKQRKLEEQYDRATSGVTMMRARIGERQRDLREDSPGGDRTSPGAIVPKKEQVLTPAERKERSVNKALGKDVARTQAAVDKALAQGRRPTPGVVMDLFGAEDRPAEPDKAEEERPKGPPPPVPLLPHQGGRAQAMMGRIDCDPASSAERNMDVRALRWAHPGEMARPDGHVWLGLGSAKRVWEDEVLETCLEYVETGRVTRLIVEWTGEHRRPVRLRAIGAASHVFFPMKREGEVAMVLYIGEEAGVPRFLDALDGSGAVMKRV